LARLGNNLIGAYVFGPLNPVFLEHLSKLRKFAVANGISEWTSPETLPSVLADQKAMADYRVRIHAGKIFIERKPDTAGSGRPQTYRLVESWPVETKPEKGGMSRFV
jgi:hypothetical protein